LVDENGRITAAHALSQHGDQFDGLTGGAAISLEENEANGIDGTKEFALEGAQDLPGTAKNDGTRSLIGQ
jgi:hypothetical protein